MSAPYSLKAVRAVSLRAQGLDAPNPRGFRAGADDVFDAVRRVGWTQIDTLQVVNRAQYVTLWSRLGDYDMYTLDRLAFDGGSDSPDNGRRLFEYWARAACLIPLAEYRNFIPMMRRRRQGRGGWHRKWASDPDNRRLTQTILAKIRADGAGKPADFRTEKKTPGAWWNWDAAKIALEHLYDVGELAIANRVNFQRVYDARERVLPRWVDDAAPSEEDAFRRLLEISMKALGICEPAQVGDYFHMKRTEAKPLIESLIADGVFVPVQATTADGEAREMLIHRDNRDMLNAAADGEIEPRRTTFLSPFDSLFWARGRDMRLWKFNQILECYKREPDRIWGYFCLPILDGGRLVGRFDPKMERKTGVMRIKSLHLEPGVRPSARLAASVARAMRDFMRFHAARDFVIERSNPPEFGAKLEAAF